MVRPVSEVAREQFPHLSRTCFDAARWHPLPQVAVEALERHARYRASDASWGPDSSSQAQQGARVGFANLIGASPADIALVPSTTAAEQLVVRALGLPESGAILTHLLHFDGSIYAYDEMRARGADIRIIAPRDGRIDLEDIETELKSGDVKLLAVAAVSNSTGFSHALAELSALAHAYGTLVYADVVQMVGAVPFDVTASGVDFCAATGFKWLMGEMGLAFLYVRPEVVPLLQRPIHGYRQLVEDIEPWPPTGPRSWSAANDAAGLFEGASLPVGAAVSLQASIGLIASLGVDNIAAHRAPLLARLERELPALCYPLITPAGSVAPFLVFDRSDRSDTERRLRAANINAGVSVDKLRISVSIFNTEKDIETLLAALA